MWTLGAYFSVFIGVAVYAWRRGKYPPPAGAPSLMKDDDDLHVFGSTDRADDERPGQRRALNSFAPPCRPVHGAGGG